jgi:hypothetical protein
MYLKSALKAFALPLPFSLAALGAFAASNADDYSDSHSTDSFYEESGYETDDYRPRDFMRVGQRQILTPDAVMRRLKDGDYSNLRRVTYSAGFYTVAAKDFDGRDVTLIIDANSGEVVGLNGKTLLEATWREERPTFKRASRRVESAETGLLTRNDVREELTREGYTDLGWLREVGNVFICNARDSGGSRVELTIDAFTGQVIDADYTS